MPVEAVVLDLDGVFFENGTETFIRGMGEEYGLSREEVQDVYSRSHPMREYKLGNISGREFWSYAAAAWRIPATMPALLALLSDAYEENPRAIALVRELKAKGVKIAACTNNFRERLAILDDRFGFRRHFDTFVASCEIGILKPDERIFTHLAESLRLPRDRILMSDDKQSNVDALNRLGFQGFLYVGFDDLRQKTLA